MLRRIACFILNILLVINFAKAADFEEKAATKEADSISPQISIEEQEELGTLRSLCGMPYPTDKISAQAFLLPNFFKYFQYYLNLKNVYDSFISSLVELPDGTTLDGSILKYTVSRGDNLSIIADKFISSTKYYSSSQLKNGILKFNNLEEFNASSGDTIIIPGFEPFKFDFKMKRNDLKGIYLTSYTASSGRGREMAEELRSKGGNMVVFDIKNVEGTLLYNSKVKLANDLEIVDPIIYDLKKLIAYLHSQNIYTVARIVAFKDEALARKKPDYAIKNNKTNKPWESGEGLVWLDPSNKEVQDYIIEISKETAEMGVDEIQYDYIRFPAEGDLEAASYDFDEVYVTKHQILTGFLNRAKKELAPYGVNLGIDVFGVVVWNNGYDAKSTGQRIECLSQYVDSIYPMVYPSHFNKGFAGIDNPAESPYFFVSESLKLFKKLTYGTNTKLVTWIQGFPYKTNNFGPAYVKAQVDALEDLGYNDFAVWSANNKYTDSWDSF